MKIQGAQIRGMFLFFKFITVILHSNYFSIFLPFSIEIECLKPFKRILDCKISQFESISVKLFELHEIRKKEVLITRQKGKINEIKWQLSVFLVICSMKLPAMSSATNAVVAKLLTA